MATKIRSVLSAVSLQNFRQRFQKKGKGSDEPSSSRGQWGHKFEFFLATLGYSVGIGNITRFPYMCMKNGGGAFLIPFIVALLAGGLPLFYIELALGQFSGLSPLTMWSFCPIFKGVGYACVALSGIVAIYYNMLLAWCILYLVKSFASDVPWRGCDNSWNTEKCYDPFAKPTCIDYSNSSETTTTTTTEASLWNSSSLLNCTEISKPPENFLFPSEDFWNNVILGTNNKGLEDVGSVRWQLAASLFTAWFIVFLCLSKGVATSGKVVYVTATVPYVLLTVLLIRGVTLDGAAEGLIFYLKPNFTTLADHNVWLEASLQMFYSLGPAWGGLITMASYNKFHHRLYIEAVVIPLSDVFTALYGGFAIFSVIGFMAKQTMMPVKKFAASGAGLAFVVYPQAIAEMPISPFWSILFFLTLLTLGIDSQFGFVDTVISGLFDLFPQLRTRKTLVTAIIAAVGFLVGLPLCTEGGMYVYVLVDWYSAAITVTAVAFLEIFIVAYIYGISRFSSDIKLMVGSKPNFLWKFSWLIACPLFMGMLLFVGLWNLRAPSYRGYEYPGWASAIGWIIALVSFAPIPGFALHALVTSPHKTISKKVSSVFLPTSEWIPAKQDIAGDYRNRYYSSKKQNKQSASSVAGEKHCVFCQHLEEAGHPIKCESVFKCWVCYCTCRLFGTSSQRTNTAAENAADCDKNSSVGTAATNRGFSIGGDDEDAIIQPSKRSATFEQVKRTQPGDIEIETKL